MKSIRELCTEGRKIWRRQVIVAIGTLVAGLALAVSPGYAQSTIEPHNATYKIKISVASGTMETIVREANGEFEAHSVIRPTGFARLLTSGTIEERSRFSVAENVVRPAQYHSDDRLSKKDKLMDFVFDWETSSVDGTINNEPFHFELDDAAQDRVSIQYQLMHNLLNDIDVSNYAMLDGDELKLLNVSKIESKRVKTPFGTFEAIGVRHQAENSKRITTLWCAEELGYLPVMIEQHREGKRRVHAVLTDYALTQPEAETAAAVH